MQQQNNLPAICPCQECHAPGQVKETVDVGSYMNTHWPAFYIACACVRKNPATWTCEFVAITMWNARQTPGTYITQKEISNDQRQNTK